MSLGKFEFMIALKEDRRYKTDAIDKIDAHYLEIIDKQI